MESFTIKYISIKNNKISGYESSADIGKIFEELAIILIIKPELINSLIEMSKIIAYDFNKNRKKNRNFHSIINLIDEKHEENINLFELIFATALSPKLSDNYYNLYSDIVKNLGYNQFISEQNVITNLIMFVFESKLLDLRIFRCHVLSSLRYLEKLTYCDTLNYDKYISLKQGIMKSLDYLDKMKLCLDIY